MFVILSPQKNGESEPSLGWDMGYRIWDGWMDDWGSPTDVEKVCLRVCLPALSKVFWRVSK